MASRSMRTLRRAMMVSVAAGLAAPLAAQPERFEILGDAGNASAFPRDISGNGSVVAGDFAQTQFSTAIAGRWVWPGPSIQSIGLFNNQGTSVDVLTRDGLTIFGGSAAGAFRWTAPGPIVADPFGRTVDITPDGAVRIVSNKRQDGGGAPVDLDVPSGYETASLRSIDASGTVIVGDGIRVEPGGGYRARGDEEFREAARWTESSGWQNLGFLPGDGFSEALAVSDDGLVVVGTSRAASGAVPRTFRLALPGQMTDLGTLPGLEGFGVEPRGMSASGDVVVGVINSSPNRAFVWTQQDGMRDLEALMRTNGQNLDQWQIINVEALSADGQYVVGSVSTLSGEFESFIAPIFAACEPPAIPAADEYSTLLSLGQALPSEAGAPTVTALPTATPPHIARGGAFGSAPTLSNSVQGYFVGQPGADPLALVRAGQPAMPGGQTIFGFSSAVTKQGGSTAFFASLSQSIPVTLSIWSGTPGNIGRIVSVGDTIFSQTVQGFESTILHNNNGRTAFFAFLSGNLIQPIVGAPGNVISNSLSAASVAAFPAGTSFINPRLSAFNDADQIAVSLRALSASIPSSTDECIMVFTIGQNTNQVRAREGSQAPDRAAGVLIGELTGAAVSMNNLGRIAFRATLSSGQNAVFAETSSGLRTLLASGDAAPGEDLGVTVLQFKNPIINDEERVVFAARLLRPNGDAFWVVYSYLNAGTPTTLLRADGVAPGLDACAEFSEVSNGYALNIHGQVLIPARLLTGGGAFSRDVLYLHDPVRGNLLISGPDQSITVSGKSRIISSCDPVAAALPASTCDGKPVALNDDGDVLFRATFIDQSQAYVRARVTPPAPPPCLGDADGNGSVTFLDITTVLANFGTVYGAPPVTGPGDADRSGSVAFLDLTTVLANFGNTCQ